MLTPDDLDALEALFQRTLEPIGRRLSSLDDKLSDTRVHMQHVAGDVRALHLRLERLESRLEEIERRLGRLLESVTRGRTTDLERIAALESRLEALEALVANLQPAGAP